MNVHDGLARPAAIPRTMLTRLVKATSPHGGSARTTAFDAIQFACPRRHESAVVVDMIRRHRC